MIPKKKCKFVGRCNINPQKKAKCLAPKFWNWHTDSNKICHALRYAFSVFQCAIRLLY